MRKKQITQSGEKSGEKGRLTHRSHLVVEDVGTLWDVVLLPVAQTCWVKVFVLNSTFGRRWGTKRHGTWGRET